MRNRHTLLPVVMRLKTRLEMFSVSPIRESFSLFLVILFDFLKCHIHVFTIPLLELFVERHELLVRFISLQSVAGVVIVVAAVVFWPSQKINGALLLGLPSEERVVSGSLWMLLKGLKTLGYSIIGWSQKFVASLTLEPKVDGR